MLFRTHGMPVTHTKVCARCAHGMRTTPRSKPRTGCLAASKPGELLVRAEGFEPTRSFEHRHLKPARIPVSPRPRVQRSYRFGQTTELSAPRTTFSHNTGEGGLMRSAKEIDA